MGLKEPKYKPDTKPTQDQLVLNTIINNIPAMVFYKNLDGHYIAANEMFCRQLKTTPLEIIGKTDIDFYDPKRAQSYQETDRKVITSGKDFEGFDEEIILDGEVRIFTTRKVLLKDHEGNPAGIIGLVYDVTENRRTEQDLIESRTRYKYMYDMFRLMADNIPDLLWAKDLRKRYLFTNKAMCETLLKATDQEEPIGKTDMFFAERERKSHPDDPTWHTFGEICADTDDITMRTKAAGRFDESGNIKGQYILLDVQKAPIMDEDGNMIGTVGSGRDITRQKMLEQEFQALFQRNRAIIQALPDRMFLLDSEGTYQESYAYNSNGLPYPPGNISGKNVTDFFEQEITDRILVAITRCLQTDTIQTFEYQINTDQIVHYFEVRLVKVDANKVLCISRDITERKTLQHALIEAKERAEESSRLKTTLLNNMSHELRTPLNGILGFSDIMANELQESEYVKMATLINNSGKRLMKTLDSVMQLSQLESGVKAMQEDKIETDVHFRQFLSSFIDQAKAKGLFFEVTKIQSCFGYLDSFFFTQAISNILDNAIKFTHAGGVNIEVTVSMEEGVRMLFIKITDTGIGISETHLKMIFEEFRQASEGRNRSFEGTGLGLTVAVKMIHLLGGVIDVKSEVGKGSVFSISIPFPDTPGYLPNQPVNEVPVIQNQPSMVGDQSLISILVVEDNEVNTILTAVYLRDKFKVDSTFDGASALEKVQQKRYDAILMDINLGSEMDGLQTTRLIRKIKGYERIPIIALTGYAVIGDGERMIAVGCTDYLPKPFSKEDLLQVLQKSLKI